ncbi:MAG: hypothetical protein EP341_03450 [Sphingomonadales bacterium]|nr:MAG: hypothetical protein EP341_03450 [Sphingomonadales bacterium]
MSNSTSVLHLKNIFVLVLAMSFAWMLSSGAFMTMAGAADTSSSDPAEALASLVGLLAACIAEVLVVAWFISRTHLRGSQLALRVFVIVFGVMFFMTQIETLFFNSAINMPLEVVAATVASGLVASLAVAALSPRYARRIALPQSATQASDPVASSIAAFVILGAAYVVLYFVVGYYVAWQSEDLREFYTGSPDILPFWEHMMGTLSGDPFLTPFQFLRGLIWAAIGLSVLNGITPRSGWQSYGIVAASLSIGLAVPLLVPNPFMPDVVRTAHFTELLISNALFGVLVVFVFGRQNR